MAVPNKLEPAQSGSRGASSSKCSRHLPPVWMRRRKRAALVFKQLKNPYYLEVGLTQTLSWVGAWTSRPSAYAVIVRTTQDVVAAVNFARENKLRLVVKGGGHSYQGTSNSADSLLIWTRKLNSIVLHDAFVGEGCAASGTPQP